jgi:hypothetical protein
MFLEIAKLTRDEESPIADRTGYVLECAPALYPPSATSTRCIAEISFPRALIELGCQGV